MKKSRVRVAVHPPVSKTLLAIVAAVFALFVVKTLHAAVGPVTSSAVMIGAPLDGVRVYPNPWRSDKHSDKPVLFDHLPAAATVKIFTVSGQFVKVIEASESGTATWDLTTDGGERAASGIYLYLITTDDGQETKGKLVLVR